jgi:hypothetical protein
MPCIERLSEALGISPREAALLVDYVNDHAAETAKDLGIELGSATTNEVLTLLSKTNRDALYAAIGDRFKNNRLDAVYKQVKTFEFSKDTEARVIGTVISQVQSGRKPNLIAALNNELLRVAASRQAGFTNALMAPLTKFMNDHPEVRAIMNSILPEGKAKWSEFNREVVKALYRDDLDSLDPKQSAVIHCAQTLRNIMDASRIVMNDQGLSIRYLKGHVPSATDLDRMIASNKDAWIESLMRNLDWDKAFPNADVPGLRGPGATDAARMKFLEGYWRAMTERGVQKHIDKIDGLTEGFAVTDKLAQHFELSKDLFFRDGDAWADYHSKFGRNADIMSQMLYTVMNRSRMAALFSVLGPLPERGLMFIKSRLMRKLETGELNLGIREAADAMAKLSALDVNNGRRLIGTTIKQALNPEDGGISMALAEASGETFHPVNQTIASRMAMLRAVKSMASLGRAVLSSVADPGNVLLSMMFKGQSWTGAMREMFHQFTLHGEVRNGFMREALSRVGVKSGPMGNVSDMYPYFVTAFESLTGEMHARFSADEPGKTAKALAMFFRVNSLASWTDMMRGMCSRMNQNWLGDHVHLGFDALPARMQYSLQMHNIGAAKWEMIRRSAFEAPDRRIYVTPELLRNVPPSEMRRIIDGLREIPEDAPEFLRNQGREMKARWSGDIEAFRRDVERDLHAFLADEVRTGVIEQDSRTRYLLLRGTRPGTLPGELFRFLSMFRSFPVGVADRLVIPGLMGGPANGAFRMDMAKWCATCMVLGYASQWLTDVSQGYYPRDVTGKHAWGSAVGAFRKAGFLGIYGDVLTGLMDTPNNRPWILSAISTAGGPAVSTGVDALSVLYAGLTGDEDWARKAFRLAWQNTPGQNIWYTQLAFQKAIIDNVEEYLQPGVVARRERFNAKNVGRSPIVHSEE